LATTGDHELAVDNWGTTALCELLQVQLRLHPQLTAERPSCGSADRGDGSPNGHRCSEGRPGQT